MKQRTLEQIEAQMAKLKEKEDALHEERRTLAQERRQLILASQPGAPSGVTVEPEPAILSAKSVQ
jgi:hypothetical protein